MLLEEEKKAIKYFYNLRSTIDESYMLFDEEINLKCGKEMIKQITIFLNLITKLQKENEILKRAFDKQTADMSNNLLELQQKDKIIDLMAKYINYLSDDLIQATGKNELEFCDGNKYCKDIDYSCEQCIKQFYERKVENESNDKSTYGK